MDNFSLAGFLILFLDWDKYKIPSISHVIHKPETRYKGVPKKHHDEEDPKERVEGVLDCKVERNSKGQYLVRGRVFDHSKPQTFNQPWTPEEQRRLEELLIGTCFFRRFGSCISLI